MTFGLGRSTEVNCGVRASTRIADELPTKFKRPAAAFRANAAGHGSFRRAGAAPTVLGRGRPAPTTPPGSMIRRGGSRKAPGLLRLSRASPGPLWHHTSLAAREAPRF